MLDFIAIGDLHLDKLSNLFPENHLELQRFEWDKACQYAVKEGIKNVIFLGDICENSRMSSDAEEVFARFLASWDNKLHFYIILGNHDWDEVGVHSLRPFVTNYELGYYKTIHILSKPEVRKIDGIKVNFQSYPGTESLANHVNVGHFQVSGSLSDNGRKVKRAHDVPAKHLWVMGHLHTPHSVLNVHYPGTLYQMNFGESLPKGFMRVQAKLSNGKLEWRVKRIKNDPRFKLFNVKLQSNKDLKQIDSNPLYKYKAFIQSEYEAPEDLMERFPNIVKTEGFKTKEEYEAAVQEAFIEIKKQTLMLPPMEKMLVKFFKNKGASKEQTKRALKLMERVSPKASK